jgi:replication factor A2
MQLRSEWREGVYVRVVGSMRVHNEKKGLIAFNLRKVTDFNELTYHLLDTCHAHLYNTRGPPPSGAKPGANQSSFFSPGRPAVGPGMGGAATPAGAMGGGAAMQVDPGMKLVDAIMAVLKGRDDGDTGTSVNAMAEECSKMLGRHVPLQEVKNATQDLTMDGVLYSTIDEEHFKPCDA